MASTSKFQAIRITEDDVPGAKLIYPEVEHELNKYYCIIYKIFRPKRIKSFMQKPKPTL